MRRRSTRLACQHPTDDLSSSAIKRVRKSISSPGKKSTSSKRHKTHSTQSNDLEQSDTNVLDILVKSKAAETCTKETNVVNNTETLPTTSSSQQNAKSGGRKNISILSSDSETGSGKKPQPGKKSARTITKLKGHKTHESIHAESGDLKHDPLHAQSGDRGQPIKNVLDIVEEAKGTTDPEDNISSTDKSDHGIDVPPEFMLLTSRCLESSESEASLALECNVNSVRAVKAQSDNDLPLTSSQECVETKSLHHSQESIFNLQSQEDSLQIPNVRSMNASKSSNIVVEKLALGPNLLKLTSEIFQTLPFKLSLKDIESKSKKKTANKINKDEKNEKQSSYLHELDIISLTDEKISSEEEQKKKTNNANELASELKPHIDVNDLYFKMNRKNLKPIEIIRNSTSTKMLKKSVIGPDLEKRDSVPLAYVSSTHKRKMEKQKRGETAGPSWYNLPKTEVTPELKKDFQLMKMRNILDPHRHYKKSDAKFPQYFQMGTVVEGAAEFYSSRISKKQRKQTMVDELLADAEFRKKNKKKYLEIQKIKQSGGKGHYKKMKNKRKPTWAKS